MEKVGYAKTGGRRGASRMLRVHDNIPDVGLQVPHSLLQCFSITYDCVFAGILIPAAKFL
jgi:hypothetical protein